MLKTKIKRKLDQTGGFNPLVIPLIIAVVLVIGSSVAAVMYYSKYTEQRDNNKPLIEDAVTVAEAAQKKKLEAEFTEREKVPTRTYTTPSELGSVKLAFPKTWSSYVANKGTTIEYYGHPGYVPATGVNYALRMTISTKSFASELKNYDSAVKKGDVKVSAVKASGVTGTKLEGLLKPDQQGAMVIFPLRDKVLKVWTESNDYKSDFNNIVLANLTFSP